MSTDEIKSDGVDQKGFMIQSLRSEDRDVRDESSGYPIAHKSSDKNSCNKWKLKPVNASSNLYNIILADDDLKTGGVDQTKWYLISSRGEPKAIRSQTSTYLQIHTYNPHMHWQANTWQITPCGDNQFKILFKGNEDTGEGSGQPGWILSCQRETEIDIRNNEST